MLARSWLQSHARASLGDESIGTIVVAAEPLGFGTTLTAENVAEIAWAARSLPEGAFASKEELFKYGTRAVLWRTRPQRAGAEDENYRAGPAQLALSDSGGRKARRHGAGG